MTSNALLAPNVIAAKAAVLVENNIVMPHLAGKDISKDFGAKIGYTITVRKPNRFTEVAGSQLQIQPIVEPSTTLTINAPYHVGWDFTSSDLTLVVDDYIRRYVRPAAIQLSNRVDLDGCAQLTNVAQYVGAVGTAITPSGVSGTIPTLSAFMDDVAIPQTERYFVMSPKMKQNLLGGTTTTNPFDTELVHGVWVKGAMGELWDIELFSDQNMTAQGHIAGTAYAQTITVKTNPAAGATAIVLAAASGTLVNGDILTFTGSNAVNPLNRASVNRAKAYVVSGGPYTLTAGGVSVTLNAYEPMHAIGDGSNYTSTDALPTTGSTVAVVNNTTSSYENSLAWYHQALHLVTVPFIIPKGAVYAEMFNVDGMAFRFLLAYDQNMDTEIARLDIQYGWGVLYPEYCFRVIE